MIKEHIAKEAEPKQGGIVERGVMPIHEEILALLRKRMKMEFEYINPNFLTAINAALSDYYECECDNVDDWIQSMYGA